MKPRCNTFSPGRTPATPASPQLQTARLKEKSQKRSPTENTLAFSQTTPRAPRLHPCPNCFSWSEVSEVSAHRSTKAHCREHVIY